MRIKYLPIVSAVFLIVAMTVQFVVSYSRNRADLLERISYKMELAQKDFLFEVYDMPDATSEIVHFVPEYGEDPDNLYGLMETVLWRYPDLFSCYICYIPNFFPEKGERYAVCALRVSRDSIVSYHFEEKLNYFEREWYIGAMRSDKNGYWSQSYKDVDTQDLIFTYSSKVHNREGKLIGVACVDYTLEWAKRMLINTLPYEDAVSQLYSSNGTMIVETGDMKDLDNMIVTEKVLSPVEMRLVTAVPKHHLWDGMSHISLITLTVLLIGILIAGLLIRRLWKDQEDYTRVETANKLLEHELHIASTIQKGILREGLRDNVKENKWTDVELQAALVPMREVGGDLYDFYRKGDDLFFIIGDVSGKSVTAAMFMSATVNLFRSAVRRLQSPKAIMEDMNGVLSGNNPSLMFVTAFIGRLHVPTGELLYCNAGHLPPLKVSTDKEQEPKPIDMLPNIPLGYDDQFRYTEQGIMLAQNEMLVLYTDGITEARNEKREMLGMKRWKEIVKTNISALIKGNLEVIGEAGMKFIGKADQTDDITLMTILKTSEAKPASLRVDNRIDQWPIIKTVLHNYGLCAGLDKRTLQKMEVALEEAVVNIVNYSQASDIELSVSHSPLTVTLCDNGIAFDPTEHIPNDKATEERQVGGLGIHLIRQIVDEIHYERREDRNILRMVKH